jgi:dicarboxylate transporter 10
VFLSADPQTVLINPVLRYDYFKALLLRQPIPIINYQLRENLLLHITASCLAGTVATSRSPSTLACSVPEPLSSQAICSPADVIRSRLMSSVSLRIRLTTPITHIIFIQQSGKTSLAEVLTKSLRDEGPKFMFKGWTPAFIRLTPNTVLLFIFFEVTIPSSSHTGTTANAVSYNYSN